MYRPFVEEFLTTKHPSLSSFFSSVSDRSLDISPTYQSKLVRPTSSIFQEVTVMVKNIWARANIRLINSEARISDRAITLKITDNWDCLIARMKNKKGKMEQKITKSRTRRRKGLHLLIENKGQNRV